MLGRILLDVVAVSASALAVVLASFQVEDGHISRLVMWVALALLAIIVTAETVDMLHAVAYSGPVLLPHEALPAR